MRMSLRRAAQPANGKMLTSVARMQVSCFFRTVVLTYGYYIFEGTTLLPRAPCWTYITPLAPWQPCSESEVCPAGTKRSDAQLQVTCTNGAVLLASVSSKRNQEQTILHNTLFGPCRSGHRSPPTQTVTIQNRNARRNFNLPINFEFYSAKLEEPRLYR